MSEVVERITVEGEFITLSLLVWRRFRRPMPGLVEQILDRNPGAANLGSHLPVGTAFNLPIPIPREPAILEPIRLW